MPKPTHIILPWPADGSTVPFEDLTQPIRKAIKAAYRMRRVRRTLDIPYKGYDIGQRAKAVSLGPDEALTAVNLAYNKEDQGPDALDVILGIAIQLGIEQGRRIRHEQIAARLPLIKRLLADHPQANMLDLLE